MKTNKARMNYLIDIVIAVGFLISAISGFILLFNSSNGYMGGRNPAFKQLILSLPRYTWKDIHNWSSIFMSLGVVLHLVLHWNWIVCMTKRIMKREKKELRCVMSD
jgi:cytochrome b subunit of formate dehydrogenase